MGSLHTPARVSAQALTAFAKEALERAGMPPVKATAVAEVLVEGDLLGHTTHGVQLLPLYLAEIETRQMALSGEPTVLADHPAGVTWDGRRLPGAWLTREAIALARERARSLGACSVVIRRSHHIGCLAAYLKPVTDQGLMILLTCSDPAGSAVAPHGGYRGVYTPNPLAAGWPTSGDPVMLDVSQSITTNLMTRRLRAQGRKFPGTWAVDNRGRPTDEPQALLTDPPGALLPMGGVDHGHKGYALGLLVEALTGGLAGHGRADPKEGWSSTTFVEVFDPALFGGSESFLRQTSWLSRACRESPPREGFDRVRLPGEGGLRRREAQLRDGVELHPDTIPALRPWAEKLGIALPEPLA
jgi:LDH2 family malate/lactate/ureidoglycolate dehydrogenase